MASPCLPGLLFEGLETPEANFPRARPATGEKTRPVAAASAQRALPENLANLGPEPPPRGRTAAELWARPATFHFCSLPWNQARACSVAITELRAGWRKRAFLSKPGLLEDFV